MIVGAIVLAAGSARRMGENKLIADLSGRPVIGHILRTIARSGLPPPIVAVPPASPIAELVGSERIVEVAGHREGMGRSLATAVGAVPAGWDAVIICLGDMPFVLTGTIMKLAARADISAIVRPTFDGKPGNPVLWGRAYFEALATCEGDRGGQALMQRYADAVIKLPCNDPGVVTDIDTIEDLAAARARISS